MSTDALFQLGIVPVSLNTTQTEDFIGSYAAAQACAGTRYATHRGARTQSAAALLSSYPPTGR